MTRLAGLIALPDGSTRSGRVSFSETVESVEAIAGASTDQILPGPIDLQVNGAGKLSVAGASAGEIIKLARLLAREGTTAFLPTVITAPLEQIEAADRAIAVARAQQAGAADGASILGMHLEGPFISPARRGIHPPCTLEPSGAALERVMQLAALRLITLAPELKGASAAISALVRRGIVVSLGHSEATLEQADQAIAAGARMGTHLFNAMRPMHHRDPGIAAAMLSAPAYAAVIPDGVHVHLAMLRLAVKARGAAGIILTTDRAPLGGGIEAKDGAARLANGTLAGSIISMVDGLRLMVERVGVSVGEAARMAATNPAALLGLADRGEIEPGRRADLIVLDRELRLKAVFIGGRELD
ncbi:MAG TPA: N-acetylglucosamine-6-phosphate deacetylase [Candidatus Binataceae bacterium]|nr:N-acetylglucosamine-6-phosphate deacetylase [Candidatus Binataceae bacterium]